MRQLRALIRQAAPIQSPVLIVGPTGSGKELVAKALHLASGRKGELVAFNVCAIADSMFEDALFGHFRSSGENHLMTFCDRLLDPSGRLVGVNITLSIGADFLFTSMDEARLSVAHARWVAIKA